MRPLQKTQTCWTMAVPDLLALERIGPDHFRSPVNQANYQAAIFGGQFLGQALSAAMATAEGKRVHSLHGYFLDAGNGEQALDYRVESLRDSPSSALRHIWAVQGDRRLFDMHCFLRVDHQGGFDHQLVAPDMPPPEDLDSFADMARADPEILGDFGAFILDNATIEVKPETYRDLRHEPGATRRRAWLRVPSATGVEDEGLHCAMLAYISDYWFSRVALVPHASPVPHRSLKFASIDHGMWFHRPARVEDWLLYDMESPSASQGTGFARGLIYDRAGRLVASTAQEVLQMPRRTDRAPAPLKDGMEKERQ